MRQNVKCDIFGCLKFSVKATQLKILEAKHLRILDRTIVVVRNNQKGDKAGVIILPEAAQSMYMEECEDNY